MNPWEEMAKMLLGLGLLFFFLGALLWLGPKLSLPRLPGDILIQKKNFTFYFPLATCLILSLLLTLIFNLLKK